MTKMKKLCIVVSLNRFIIRGVSPHSGNSLGAAKDSFGTTNSPNSKFRPRCASFHNHSSCLVKLKPPKRKMQLTQRAFLYLYWIQSATASLRATTSPLLSQWSTRYTAAFEGHGVELYAGEFAIRITRGRRKQLSFFSSSVCDVPCSCMHRREQTF